MRRAPKYVLLGASSGALSGGVARGWLGALVGACVGSIGGAITAIVSVPDCPPASRPVLLIGDSLAVGLAPRLQKLAASCSVPFGADAQVGSHVTEWGAARFDAALARLGAGGVVGGVVLVSLGGNDYQHADPAKVADAIAGLVAQIKDAGARPRWIAPPRLPFEDRAGVVALWRYELGGAAPWRDYYPTSDVDVAIGPDGIHPTARGYDELGRSVWKWLATVET